MFHRAVLTSVCVSIAFLCGSLGCGNPAAPARITVNGQTIDLKESATETIRKSFPTPTTPRVRVEVFSGKVAVEKGAAGAVEAEVTKTAAGETKEEAQAHLQLIDVQMQQEGDTVRITALRPEVKQGPDHESLRKQFGVRSADVVVRVPAGASLELKTAFGDVKATGISGRVEAETSSGAVSVSDGDGELKLMSSFGNVTVQGRNQAVNAVTKSGEITVRGSHGPIDATSGFGAVTIEEAAEKITAHSNSGNVTVKAAQGSVTASSGFGTITVDGGSAIEAETKSGDIVSRHATGLVRAKSGFGKLTVEQAPEGATLETKSGDICIKAARGPVKLSSGFGQIDAEVVMAQISASSNSGDVRVRGRLSEGAHEIHSNFGKVSLALPPDSQFRLDAHTKFGRVSTTFDLAATGKKDDKHLAGTVGEDAKTTVKLTTNSGDIDVRKE